MIRRLAFRNFLPFRGAVELDLHARGLVLVRGRNEISAACDANGVGKTSVVDALCWGFFGETVDGRKADAVVCRFAPKGLCEVRMDLEDSLGAWTLERTRNPARLRLTGVPGVEADADMATAQAVLEQRLGFGVRTFRNAVVFGQGAVERFSTADQAEQMRILDEIQGLDLRGDLQRAQEWRRSLQDRLQTAETAAARERSRVEDARRTVANLTAARDGFRAQQAERCKAIEVEVADAERHCLDAGKKLDDALRKQGLLIELRPLLQAVTAAKAALDAAADGLDAASRQVRQDMKASDALQERLDALLREDTCPTCRRDVGKSRDAVAALFTPDVQKAKDVLEASRSLEKEKYAAHHEAEASLAAAKRAFAAKAGADVDPAAYVNKLEGECGDATIRSLGSFALRAQEVLTSRTAQLDEERWREWDGAAALSEAETVLTAAAASVLEHEKTAAKVAGVLKLAEYFVEAFGDRGIRNVVADGAADFLNARLARHLEALTCGELTVRISPQTATKKGAVKDRLSLTSEWVWGGVNVGSGGQDRRRDLAMLAAVQDLAELRSARPFPLRVFDEPFDALDARGREMACAWVRQIAREHGTALLVTHSEEVAGFADPDETWTVVMGRDGGARVEVSR